MKILTIAVFATILLADGVTNAAEPFTFGDDTYITGFGSDLSQPAKRDLFISGFSVDVAAPVEGNVHAAAADIDVVASVKGDIDAAGLAVRIGQPVGRDLSVIAASIKVTDEAAIAGNARLAAGEIVITAPIKGHLLAAARTITINAPISGDAHLFGQNITFGSDARFDGQLLYSAPAPIDIPAGVAAADRVRFEPLKASTLQVGMSRTRDIWPTLSALVMAGAVVIAFLVIVAGLLLSFAPQTSAALQCESTRAPLRTMGIGILGLAMLLGLLPLCVVTLVGLPFIPLVLLAIMALWVGGYLLGAMGLTFRILEGFKPIPHETGPKLALIGAGLLVIATLNFVPVVGWLLNLCIMFLGLGAILAHFGRRALGRKSSIGGDEHTPRRA